MIISVERKLFREYITMAKAPKFNRKRSNRSRKITRKLTPTRAFAKKVQKVISKNIETKTAVHQSNVTAYNAPLSATGDCLRLIPAIAQNATQNGLLGAEIRMQSLNLRGVMTFQLSQTTANNTRIGVRLTILRAKRFDDWNAAATDFATNYTRLLEVPAGIINGQNLGTLTQFNCPINRDYFSVVADKRYYLSQSLNVSPGTTTNSTVYTTKFVNMNIPYSRRIVKFDQGFDTDDAVNYPYFMLINYCKLDGSSDVTPPSAGESLLTFQYVTTMKYEDA